ncbi:uncharacterized protein [Antedon mediterranea]|uniref:uncharacterized protein n=1 Tax=Antedon mediterranea TaxID=105859 RepID=UPI003AF56D6B
MEGNTCSMNMKRSSQGFECDQLYKRSRSISEIVSPLNGINLYMNDDVGQFEQLNEVIAQNVDTNKEEEEGEEEEGGEMVKEEALKQTIMQGEDACDEIGKFVGKAKKCIFSIFNNLAEEIFQKPEEKTMKDVGTPVHMKDDSGNGVPIGIRLLQRIEGGFEICHVEEKSVVKDKLRSGDRIVLVNEEDIVSKQTEEVLAIFMKSSLEIKIRRTYISEEDNTPHTFEFVCKITYNDKIEVTAVSIETAGGRALLIPDKNSFQRGLCFFRNDLREGMKEFVRCNSTTVFAGRYDPILSPLDVHRFINFSSQTNRQVMMFMHDKKFINVSSSRQLELTVGKVSGALVPCDGRAFTMSIYPQEDDRFLIESVQYPRHYLAIDGTEVKLLKVENDRHFLTKQEATKCRIETIKSGD